jgi:hypothetical protein
MAARGRLWGAERIRGELLKLRILPDEVGSQHGVARYLFPGSSTRIFLFGSRIYAIWDGDWLAMRMVREQGARDERDHAVALVMDEEVIAVEDLDRERTRGVPRPAGCVRLRHARIGGAS